MRLKFFKIPKRAVVFICVTLASIFIVFSTIYSEKEEPVPEENKKIVMPVSVIEVEKSRVRSKTKLLGEVNPKLKLTLKSQVSGKITYLSEKLKKGVLVKKDDLLLKIDNTAYISRVAQVRARYANAELALLKEKRESEEALSNWRKSGLNGKPDPLTLRVPNLKVAESEVNAAKKSLNSAGKELSYCIIKAPFDGLITEIMVVKGDSLSQGDSIFQIFGTKKAVITVNINEKQWSNLPSDITSIKAELVNTETGYRWQAEVVRDGKRIIPESRMRQLFLEVKKPLSFKRKLLFGSFLSIILTGKEVGNILKLPEQALTKSGRVWFVENSTLKSYKTEPLLYDDGMVYISPPSLNSKKYSVCVSPNFAYINGLKVNPVFRKER